MIHYEYARTYVYLIHTVHDAYVHTYMSVGSECTGPWCEPCHNGSCECPPNVTWCHPGTGGGYCESIVDYD